MCTMSDRLPILYIDEKINKFSIYTCLDCKYYIENLKNNNLCYGSYKGYCRECKNHLICLNYIGNNIFDPIYDPIYYDKNLTLLNLRSDNRLIKIMMECKIKGNVVYL
jgi:hypothetical protein